MMYFTQKLVRKNNILCEYIMLRKAFKAYKENLTAAIQNTSKSNIVYLFYFETIP